MEKKNWSDLLLFFLVPFMVNSECSCLGEDKISGLSVQSEAKLITIFLTDILAGKSTVSNEVLLPLHKAISKGLSAILSTTSSCELPVYP